MRKSIRFGVQTTPQRLALKVLILVLLMIAAVFGWGDGPPPRFTGVYEEPNCRFCHDTYRLDEGRERGGSFAILDVPEQYTPGATYTITVQLGQPGQRSWGFELATRFMEERRQAGSLSVTDPENTQIVEYDDLAYIMQTRPGTYAGRMDGPVQWRFNWTAPESGMVLFAATGNAANGPIDAYIYATQEVSTAAADSDKP